MTTLLRPLLRKRIGVMAPASPIPPVLAERVMGLAPPGVEIVFHPQCFLTEGHFAGPDRARVDALVELANDPGIDAVWFARGGYGAARIAEAALDRMGEAARRKAWMGYSDGGALLAGLHRRGFGAVLHGPIPGDLNRKGGEAAVKRALDWLCFGDASALEPSVRGGDGPPSLAFNIAVLSSILGTRLEPDFEGRVLMLEEVSEHLYAIDRFLFQITSTPSVRKAAGIRFGRILDVPENDRPFGEEPLAMIRRWCARSGLPFLGEADIGHDAANKVVPFG